MSKSYTKSTLADFTIELVKSELRTGSKSYRADPAINQSFLKDVNSVSPSYADYRRLNPEETPALVFGSALHTLVLEPLEFNKRYAMLPECDRRTKEGKALYEDFCLSNVGKVVLKSDDVNKLLLMAEKSRSHFESKTSHKSYAEANLFGTFAVTGGEFKGETIDVKAQLDMLHVYDDRCVIQDLKSVADISNVSGASYHSGWATQSAFYNDLTTFAFRKESSFEYVAQSKDEPYDVRKFIVSDEMFIKGRLAFTSAMHKWLWWKKNGKPETAEFHGNEILNG